MFQDTDGDGTQDAGEQTLWVSGALEDPFSIAASLPQIRYLPAGTLSVSPVIVSFTVCRSDSAGETGRSVVVSPTGQATVNDFGCP